MQSLREISKHKLEKNCKTKKSQQNIKALKKKCTRRSRLQTEFSSDIIPHNRTLNPYLTLSSFPLSFLFYSLLLSVITHLVKGVNVLDGNDSILVVVEDIGEVIREFFHLEIRQIYLALWRLQIVIIFEGPPHPRR